ncbi:MAG: pentapeptide repeat-containing protein [Heliobacteriaceae bacterium]|jgi:uncharacterized protein YjbI with pentapeptide repeats|nr:pentapeptide repeat-containing protein [Heliobacteriaceae bacterium]
MIDYTKEELVELLRKHPEKFNEWKAGQNDVDLSEVDLSGIVLNEIDFSDVDLNSSSFADSSVSLVKFINTDLTSVDFTRSKVLECDFSESLLTGADCSYAEMNYCNFQDCDMAGCILSETDLGNSDLTGAVNINASRFDDATIWPEQDLLPEDFDGAYNEDLSSLKDEDDDLVISDYE